MEAFTLFSQLPPELRSLIWKSACENEASTNTIFFDPRGVGLPSPGLVSTMLGVSRESRLCAKLFYKASAPVYRVVDDESRNEGDDSLYEVTRQGTCYLNLDYSIAVLGALYNGPDADDSHMVNIQRPRLEESRVGTEEGSATIAREDGRDEEEEEEDVDDRQSTLPEDGAQDPTTTTTMAVPKKKPFFDLDALGARGPRALGQLARRVVVVHMDAEHLDCGCCFICRGQRHESPAEEIPSLSEEDGSDEEQETTDDSSSETASTGTSSRPSSSRRNSLRKNQKPASECYQQLDGCFRPSLSRSGYQPLPWSEPSWADINKLRLVDRIRECRNRILGGLQTQDTDRWMMNVFSSHGPFVAPWDFMGYFVRGEQEELWA